MQRIVVSLFLGILFIGIGIYVSINTSPFNIDSVKYYAQTDNFYTDKNFETKLPEYIKNGLIWEIVNGQQLITIITIWILAFISSFSFFHMLIDKLFFKKFYEEANIFTAFRRGFLLSLVIIGTLFLKLINGITWYNIVSIVILVVCIEIVFLNILRKKQ